MFGAVMKSYFAEKIGKKPEDIFSVAIMPCVAKKVKLAWSFSMESMQDMTWTVF